MRAGTRSIGSSEGNRASSRTRRRIRQWQLRHACTGRESNFDRFPHQFLPLKESYPAMGTLSLRTELSELIAKEKDVTLLHVLKDILSGGSKDALLKAKLTARALKAEEDLAAGRTLDTKQVRARLSARRKS